MAIESRPAIYLPTLTDDNVLNYAESYAETALEKELLSRWKEKLKEIEDAI